MVAKGDGVKKPRVNSRSKGRSFEQKIATRFREALGDGWTVTRNQTDRQGGQVAGCAGEFTVDGPPGQRFRWCVECKAHESFDYGQLWSGTGPFKKFWGQAESQASVADLEPLLIFKRNNGPILAAINAAFIQLDAIDFPFQIVDVGIWEDVFVCTFDDFMRVFPHTTPVLATR